MTPPSLNLLPPSKKTALHDEVLLTATKRHLVSLGIFFIVFVGVLMSTKILLERRLSEQKKLVQTLQEQTVQEQGQLLEEKIRAFNTVLNRVQTVQQGYVQWSPILYALTTNLPSGITLHSIEADQETKLLILRGIAARRDDLLHLQEQLKSTPYFSNPSAPVSSLLVPENIIFEMTVDLQLP